jgi:hypothetical protein
MADLEERQREMRDRMKREGNAGSKKQTKIRVPTSTVKVSDSPELEALKKRILALETENKALRAESKQLRRQKSIVVERPREESYDERLREQRHNFFKYSNLRRY